MTYIIVHYLKFCLIQDNLKLSNGADDDDDSAHIGNNLLLFALIIPAGGRTRGRRGTDCKKKGYCWTGE